MCVRLSLRACVRASVYALSCVHHVIVRVHVEASEWGCMSVSGYLHGTICVVASAPRSVWRNSQLLKSFTAVCECLCACVCVCLS